MSDLNNNNSNNENHEHEHGHEHDHSHETQPATRDTRYWLSLEQWQQDPDFQKLAETEFLSSPLREDTKNEEGWARREFLKLMGASLAMASAGCIRRPVEKIVPYNKQPEEVTFGVAGIYTSTFFDGSEVMGLAVRTHQGRPIKIEGNENHPMNKGGASARAQAHILSVYDPERLNGPRHNLLNKQKTNRDTISVKWDALDDATVKQLKKGGVVVLTGYVQSPSTRALIADFSQAFNAQHVSWEPLSVEDLRQGAKASFGVDAVPFYNLDKAKIIVSIDADFLGTWLAPTTFTKHFSQGRKDIKNMNKLVVFESGYSLTGANADIRQRIKPSQQVDVVMGLLHQVLVKKGHSKYASDSKHKNAVEAYANVAAEIGADPKLFAKLAEDLIANAGKSVVIAGGPAAQTEHSLQLQMAVNLLNSALGNIGSTVELNGFQGLNASNDQMLGLIEKLNKGEVKTVIIHKVNPVYAMPADAGFKEALKKAELVLYTGDRNDETGKVSDYIIPDHHQLESWGDAEFTKGVYSVQQPTIRPLYDTRSFQLSLMSWAYLANLGPKRILAFETYYDYLRNYWKEEIFPKAGKGRAFEDFWDDALQSGVMDSASGDSSSPSFSGDISGAKPSKKSGYELVLYPTVAFRDGTLSNVSWLHELPDPVTKICWDNYVSVSIKTAEKLNLKEGYLVELAVGDKKLTLPGHIQPGLHDDVVAVAVGYGRTDAGKLGNNNGVNAYELVSYKNNRAVYSGLTTEIKNTGKKYELATQQGHHSMEGRKIVVEATLQEYLKDPAANNERPQVWSIWSGHQYNGYKWGMAVDLNSCTGCSACMIACQSENNIPVVGKNYVLQGREMHWMRIDRYYVGDPENAQVVYQPVMCQHCDNAPCETVCPVLATVHSNEGTNDMVYNRCVGTRYCSNNCPYKVRRFNWFNFHKNEEKPLNLAYNPDVTVRVRGVMEKCTFCVQRIKSAKNTARLEDRKVRDGEIKTACEQSCPANAITFGDLNNPESRVAQIFKDEPRSYGLIEEFHAKPSVRYMTKIRNNDQDKLREDHTGGHT